MCAVRGATSRRVACRKCIGIHSLGRTGEAGSPTLACPRCKTALREERFGGDGPDVLRCSDCQGLFLSRDVLPAVAALDPSAAPASHDTGLVERVVAALRSLLRSS